MIRSLSILILASLLAAADPLDDVRARFFYDGQPIHPGIIELFSPWISDSEPLVLSVDLAKAQGSNQFFDTPKPQPSGWVESPPKKDGSSFAYRFIGALPSGLLVLLIVESGGGSGQFESLMLFTVGIEQGWNDDGSRRTEHVLHVLRDISLGDRADAVVTIASDRIHVTRSQSLPNELHDPLDIADPLLATASGATAHPWHK